MFEIGRAIIASAAHIPPAIAVDLFPFFVGRSWLRVKDRCLLGSGSANPPVAVFTRQEVGIRGDFESYAVPRSFGTFSRRVPYFHEGLSLQECVLPVIAVRLKKDAGAMLASIEVQISYKAGKTNQVTTRMKFKLASRR